MNIYDYCIECKTPIKENGACVLCLRETLNRFDNIKPPAKMTPS